MWGDRWVPALPLGRPTPLGSVHVSRNLRVESLINPVTGVWDVDFLKPFLEQPELETILDLHIGDSSRSDRLIWPFEKNGKFSIKSGYHWAIDRYISPPNSSLSLIPTCFWKLVWSLKTPPKIRSFLWKTLHGALATMENLARRRSAQSPLCPICQLQEETIEHLFLQCPWVSAIWRGGCFSLRVGISATVSWAHWLLQVFTSVKGSKEVSLKMFSYIAFTC